MTGAEQVALGYADGDPLRDTIGACARDTVERWWRLPAEIQNGDGRWVSSPAKAEAAKLAHLAATVAAEVLGVRACDIGPCGHCRAHCHRYGPGGRAWCRPCQRENPTTTTGGSA